MRTRLTQAAALLAVGALFCWLAASGRLVPDIFAQDKRPADKTPYKFAAGFPTPEATQRARDDVDYQRALTAYRFWYPTVSMEGLFHGSREAGMRENQSMLLLVGTPSMVVLTANSDTPYAFGVIDLKDGPMAVVLPPGRFMAFVNDHHQRWIMDMGLTGPDEGKGGKHLILPPDYKDKPPAGYYVGRASSFKVLLAIRAIPETGDMKKAVEAVRSVKIHPLADPARRLQYIDRTGKEIRATSVPWEDNIQFWQKLHEIINYEPVLDEYRPMHGLLLALGISRDKRFAPDARLKGILERAARDGKGQMLVSAFDSARPDRIVWKDRRWEWLILTPDSVFFETPSGLDLEARDSAFMQGLGTAPVMFRRRPGIGSTYWRAARDKDGNWLDGGKTYRLSVPLPVPAQLFWSVTVYDPETRSQIQTDQNQAALRSLVELAPEKIGKDAKEVDLYFGPKAPQGKEGHWIKTTAGKGWFAYFRVYGLEKATFDGSWKPGDFEETK